MEVLKTKKYLGIAGVVILFLSVFFPFFVVQYGSFKEGVSLIKGWEGYVLVLMAIASAMIIFRDVLEEKLPQIYNTGFGSQVKSWGEKGLFAPIAFSILDVVITCVRVEAKLKAYSYGFIDLSKYVKYGFGFWAAVIGIVLLIGYAVLYKGEGASATSTNNMMQPQQPVQPQMNPSTDTFTQPMQQPMAQPMQQPMSQPMQQPMSQPMAQPMSQPTEQPMQGQDFNNNNNQF